MHIKNTTVIKPVDSKFIGMPEAVIVDDTVLDAEATVEETVAVVVVTVVVVAPATLDTTEDNIFTSCFILIQISFF